MARQAALFLTFHLDQLIDAPHAMQVSGMVPRFLVYHQKRLGDSDDSIIKLPIVNNAENSTSQIAKSVIDPLYINGGGVLWGIAKMWFWILAMIFFAKTYCDYQVNRFFHVHATQSGMVFFIMHRCFSRVLVHSLFNDLKLQEPIRLWLVVSVITYVLCIACYALFVRYRYTRMMFGLIKV